MKNVIATTIVLTLILAAVSSGTESSKGGKAIKGEGFKIDVPTFDTKVKPGEIQISGKRIFNFTEKSSGFFTRIFIFVFRF